MTTRRDFLIAAGAVLGPLEGAAQHTVSIPTVGILSLEVAERVTPLKEGLLALGYVAGRNIRFEERPAGDRYARLAEIANEYVRLKADVIVTMGSTATRTATKVSSTIPIVMVAGVDPVKEKLAASLAHPGGNVTGVSTILQDLTSKRLALAKEVVPALTRVGIFWNPDSATSTGSLLEARQAAKALNLQLQPVEARSPADFDKAFETLTKSHTNIFVMLPSSMFAANRKQILESAARHRVAGVFYSVEWVNSGGLFSYGPSDSAAVRQAAVYVGKILKGAKPGDLPIEQPTKFELGINLNNAKRLDVTVPQSILIRADRVIE